MGGRLGKKRGGCRGGGGGGVRIGGNYREKLKFYNLDYFILFCWKKRLTMILIP
jgi:hypothetical protein